MTTLRWKGGRREFRKLNVLFHDTTGTDTVVVGFNCIPRRPPINKELLQGTMQENELTSAQIWTGRCCSQDGVRGLARTGSSPWTVWVSARQSECFLAI